MQRRKRDPIQEKKSIETDAQITQILKLLDRNI